jgi:hypothetical protein
MEGQKVEDLQEGQGEGTEEQEQEQEQEPEKVPVANQRFLGMGRWDSKDLQELVWAEYRIPVQRVVDQAPGRKRNYAITSVYDDDLFVS